MSVAPSREGLKLYATRPFAANASTPTLPVAELAVLLEVKEGTSDEDIQELIDNLYTVQYYSGAGVTCFSAGEAPGAGPGSYTHAFHARFPNETALENFKRHPQFVAVMDDLVAPACARVTSASFLGEVENDMFAVFMRGDEYDSGVQRMVLIDGGDGAFNGRSGDVIALMAAVAAS